MNRIGFIGLGMMGRGMAASLLNKGFTVTVWNRDQAKCQPLIDKGATLAPSLTYLAQNSEVVISMLRDDPVVRKIILEETLPAAKPGTAFIDMSTITPSLSRHLAEAATARGCHFLAAPVLGSRDAAANGQLSILVGGSAEVLEAHRDLLSAMGQKVIHVGPHGSSAFLKLACNQMAAVAMAAVGESLSLIEEAGLDRQAAVEILIETLARVAQMKQAKITGREWSTHFALDLMLKDMTQTLQAADEMGVPMPVLAVARETYQRARRQGKGKLDFAVVTDSSHE